MSTNNDMQKDQEAALVAALRSARRLCKEALPKFNWGASALDANSIRLLDTVPGIIDATLNAWDRAQRPAGVQLVPTLDPLRPRCGKQLSGSNTCTLDEGHEKGCQARVEQLLYPAIPFPSAVQAAQERGVAPPVGAYVTATGKCGRERGEQHVVVIVASSTVWTRSGSSDTDFVGIEMFWDAFRPMAEAQRRPWRAKG